MRFFADANIPRQGARLLEVFDLQNNVEHLEDYFLGSVSDVEWMRAISEWDPKPIVLCGDGRILRNKVERRTLRECDLTFIYLSRGWTNMPWDVWSWKIIKVWPDVVGRVADLRNPTVFEVKPGQLKVERMGRTSSL